MVKPNFKQLGEPYKRVAKNICENMLGHKSKNLYFHLSPEIVYGLHNSYNNNNNNKETTKPVAKTYRESKKVHTSGT